MRRSKRGRIVDKWLNGTETVLFWRGVSHSGNESAILFAQFRASSSGNVILSRILRLIIQRDSSVVVLLAFHRGLSQKEKRNSSLGDVFLRVHDREIGTGFYYIAPPTISLKIHVSYEAVQHAKKHGLTDNRVSENRSGTNDLLSTRKRATKFSKRETISIRFSKISLMAFFFYDNTFANWNFAPFVLSISKSPEWIAFWFILNLSNDIII